MRAGVDSSELRLKVAAKDGQARFLQGSLFDGYAPLADLPCSRAAARLHASLEELPVRSRDAQVDVVGAQAGNSLLEIPIHGRSPMGVGSKAPLGVRVRP